MFTVHNVWNAFSLKQNDTSSTVSISFRCSVCLGSAGGHSLGRKIISWLHNRRHKWNHQNRTFATKYKYIFESCAHEVSATVRFHVVQNGTIVANDSQHTKRILSFNGKRNQFQTEWRKRGNHTATAQLMNWTNFFLFETSLFRTYSNVRCLFRWRQNHFTFEWETRDKKKSNFWLSNQSDSFGNKNSTETM